MLKIPFQELFVSVEGCCLTSQAGAEGDAEAECVQNLIQNEAMVSSWKGSPVYNPFC